MKFLIIVLLITALPVWSKGKAVCNHGAPQTLGIERLPVLAGLPYLKGANQPPLKLNQQGSLLKNLSKKATDFLGLDLSNKSQNKRMSILILSATNDPALEPTIELAQKILNNYGIPFDHFNIVENKIKTNPLPKLVNENGEALYYGIILSTGQLAYANAEGIFQSALNPTEWETLRQFTRDYDIRTLSLYSYPNPTIGLENVPLEAPGKLTLLEPTPFYKGLDQSYPKNVTFSLQGSWAYTAKVLDPTLAKPVLFYDQLLDQEGKKGPAAAQITFPDGREEMHYFFAQSALLPASTTISSAWVGWLTRDTYVGKRRIVLGVHIDDVFLSTSLYSKYEDPDIDGPFSEKFVYRLSADDMEYFVKQQAEELRPLTQNPEFRIDMAFNGNGIMEAGGYAKDDLVKKSVELLSDFTWLTHTFTHGDLNWLNYEQSKWELKTNILVAEDFIRDQTQWFSKSSIVTPRISGLFNGGAIHALETVGIKYAVGDNTRKELLPANIHHGFFTTKEVNGWPGLFIIPRNATEIYYNVSTPDELADEYNFIYRKHFGKDSSPEEIFIRESLRVTRQLLNYEYAPYMFHQANLRSFKWLPTKKRESLVGLWIKYVVDELRKYSTLPVISLKMDDLVATYFERMATDACKPEVWQQIKAGKIDSLRVTTQKACPVSITVPKKMAIEGWKNEQYGSESTYENKFTNASTTVYNVSKQL